MLTAATRKVSWNMTLSFVLCNVFKSSCIAFLCTKTLSYTHTCTVYICLKWRNLCCGILLTSDFDKIATWPTGHDRCCSGCHKAWKTPQNSVGMCVVFLCEAVCLPNALLQWYNIVSALQVSRSLQTFCGTTDCMWLYCT